MWGNFSNRMSLLSFHSVISTSSFSSGSHRNTTFFRSSFPAFEVKSSASLSS